MKNGNADRHRFALYCLFFFLFLFVLASINEIQFNSLSNFKRCALNNISSQPEMSILEDSLSKNSSPTTDEIRVLLGILTLPDDHHKRHFLRMVYGTQSTSSGTRVDLKFVFCNLTTEEQKVLVALEIMSYNDIIILNCQENMDKGKTYTYFSSLPEILNSTDKPYPPYHYVLKADDDTYFRLHQLVESLRPLSREDLYYGFAAPCLNKDPFSHYMSGMGYLVSWDIVEWIRESEIPKSHMIGPEDKVFGQWLRDGRKAKNRFNGKWYMYDYPNPRTSCTRDLWPETIAIHRLKSQEKWIDTLKYFNVSANLKPSMLYHIP